MIIHARFCQRFLLSNRLVRYTSLPFFFMIGFNVIPLRMREEINRFDKMGLAVDGVDHLPGIIKIYQLDLLPYGQVFW